MRDSPNRQSPTAADEFKARLLAAAPWLAFLVTSLPAPLYFLYLYFTVASDAAVFMLLAMTSLPIGAIAGVLAALVLVMYRRRWAKRIRDRIAADGITASELHWFTPELTTAERAALKSIDSQNRLLADAYRETLAARVTAARVVASAKRDLVSVERRANRLANIRGADTGEFQAELAEDRARLERVRDTAAARRAEVEARLQMIEAAASRGASWAETDFALRRLEAAHEQLPLALEAARLEREAREDAP